MFTLTVGSGRSTAFDNSSPPGAVAHHGTRLYCVVSHFSHDDPIVHPGRQGAAHAHMFWGNTGADHASTAASLLNSGNSSCEGGITNRSSYWVPALFNASNEVVLPESIFVYYKSFGGPGFDRSTLQPIPVGLEMLASRNVAGARDGHFRISGSGTSTELMIGFPECIAVDPSGSPVLSSADNVSHLSYPAGGGPSGCPASHPYRVPQVSYILRFAVPFASDWSLASDHHGGTKGASLHADYFAAWETPAMDALVECTIVARGNCGFAGGRGQLPERFVGPDGQVVYQSSASLAPGSDRTPFGTTITKMLR